MATNDFYQDAEQSLSADPEGSYILLYAQQGQEYARFRLNVPSPHHMRWLMGRMKDVVTQWERENNHDHYPYFNV